MLHLGAGQRSFFLQSQDGLTPEVPGSRFPRLRLLSRQTPSLSGEIRGHGAEGWGVGTVFLLQEAQDSLGGRV